MEEEEEAAETEEEEEEEEVGMAGAVETSADGYTLLLSRNNGSGYKGVTKGPDGRFSATRWVNGFPYALGRYDTAIEAAVAYSKHVAGRLETTSKPSGSHAIRRDGLYTSRKSHSGYMGVQEKCGKFNASRFHGGKTTHIGVYNTAIEAARAYAQHRDGVPRGAAAAGSAAGSSTDPPPAPSESDAMPSSSEEVSETEPFCGISAAATANGLRREENGQPALLPCQRKVTMQLVHLQSALYAQNRDVDAATCAAAVLVITTNVGTPITTSNLIPSSRDVEIRLTRLQCALLEEKRDAEVATCAAAILLMKSRQSRE